MEDKPDSKFYTTARNIDGYSKGFGMNREEFISWLKNKKKILNVASGGGLLEKEFDLINKNTRQPKTQIYSLDLLYNSQSGLEFHKYSSFLLTNDEDVQTGKLASKSSRMNSRFERKSVAADFNQLPFPQDTFDGILASYALIHINDSNKLGRVYEEIYRVLKPQGEALVTLGRRNVLPENLSFKISEIQKSEEGFFVRFTKN